jgi:hypothetical protein
MKKLILYSFILLMSQCNKYDDTQLAANLQVPAYTETGANTFGCLVNGTAWATLGETFVYGELGGGLVPNVTNGSFIYDSANADSLYTATAALTVSKQGMVLRREQMMLLLPVQANEQLKGVHQLTSPNGLFRYTDIVKQRVYSNLIRNPFTVTIKKDSLMPNQQRIVSGTFGGILYNSDQTDSVRIVGGVFDTLVR